MPEELRYRPEMRGLCVIQIEPGIYLMRHPDPPLRSTLRKPDTTAATVSVHFQSRRANVHPDNIPSSYASAPPREARDARREAERRQGVAEVSEHGEPVEKVTERLSPTLSGAITLLPLGVVVTANKVGVA